MKSVGLFLATAFVLLFGATSAAAKTTTWTPTTGGSWATAGNWNNGVPAATDTVIISSDQSSDITAVPTISLNTLTISGNCNLDASATANTLTVTGTFTVAAGKTFELGNNTRILFVLSSTGTGTISGTVIMHSGSTNRLFQVDGDLTIASAGVINDDGGTNNSDFTLSSGATLRIGSTAGISSTGASGNIQVTGTISFSTGANYVYNGTAAQATGTGLPTGLTGTLTINNPGNTVTLDNARTIASGGTVNIIAGTFAAGTNLTMATTSSITRGGGTMTGTPQGAGIYNVTYTGNSMTTSTELAGTGLNNVTANLTAGQTLTLDVNRAPDGNLSVTTGTFDLSSLTINRSAAGGTLTVSNGATLKIGGTNTFPTNYSTHTLGATSTVEYSGTAQNVSAETYGHLTTSGSGTKTMQAATIVNGTFTIGSGTTLDEAAIQTTMASGGSLVVNGTLDFTSSTGNIRTGASGAVTLTLAAAGLIRTVDDLGLGPATNASLQTQGTGTWTTTSISTNGTVEYNRNATSGQVVTDTDYNNLTITGSTQTKTWTVAATRTVNGTVTINASAPLTLSGAQTINVKGNWSNAGTFTAGTSTINFNGASAQSIGGASSTTFSGLSISNSAGVTLNTNGSVATTLTLNNDLTTDVSNGIALTASGSTSAGTADVVGDVTRNDITVSAKAFGNLNTTVLNGTAMTLTVTLVKSAPQNFTSVKRIYTLTIGAGSVSSATLKFHYVSGDVNGNTAGSLHLYRYNGTTWADNGATGLTDTANVSVQQTGIGTFSSWTMANGGLSPTAVNLTRFNAASFSDGVSLVWESGFEVNNLGYRVYREQNGMRTRVTPSIVAGSALKIGAGRQMTAGYSYSWFDPQGTSNTAYYLEAIDLNGARQWIGPLYPARGYGESPVGKGRRAILLGDMTAASRQQAQQSWPAGRSPTVREGVAAIKVSRESFALQQQIAAGQAVKIAVRQSGWYRVSQPELVAAGLNASADARNLQLYVDGQQVPIRLSNDGVSLGVSDTLEFYGVALNTPTSDTHVYYLINGTTPGMRVSNKRSKLKGTDLFTESVARNFAYTTQRQDKLIYFPSLLNGEAENIFGDLISTDPTSETISVSGADPNGPQPQLEIALQGGTLQNHQVQVQLNGANVGAINLSAFDHKVTKFALDPSLLHNGDNTLTLVAQNGDEDVTLVDWVRVTYGHQYTADNNALAFSAPAGQAVRVDGFTNANIRVIDITDPNAVGEVPVSVGPAGTGYAAKLQTRSATVRTLIAFTDDLVKHPATVTANQPSSWNSGVNTADLVIITHKDFRSAIEPLAMQRRSQGLNVAVVDVEDVFDEFSYGAHTPYAVRDFLAWTTTHWQTAPQYVLLVGDSSWDPRNYLDQGSNDFVPTKLIDTSLMETMSDDWLADFSNTGLAQMAVGRLPGRSSAEINLMVSKINAYEVAQQAGGPPRGALLVSDRGFEGENSQTKAQLLPSVPVQTIDRAQVNDDNGMSSQIIDAINAGPMLVNYYGHGSVDVWTGAGVLNDANAATLSNNSRLSVFVIMTCLNGYAGDAYIDSLGEALIKSQNGGAAAVWASSGFTSPEPQFALSTSFYQQVFGGTSPRLGDAIRNAKVSIGDNDVRRTWILLGDPTMRIR
jgi:hypothetical protein